MNENNALRLYNYLKNNYRRFYNDSIHYSYVCSSARFHYFIQCVPQKFKIKAINKENKDDVIIYPFSDHKELTIIFNQVPSLKIVFANIVKQISYYSYLVLNRVNPSATNVDNSLYVKIRESYEKHKSQYSDYLNREENTIVGTPLRFSAQNIFIDDRDRVARVQITPDNILTSNTMTEQRVREIVQQAFRERIGELMERQNRIASDPRVEQNLRELRLRVEELSRRFDRRRNPEQR